MKTLILQKLRGMELTLRFPIEIPAGFTIDSCPRETAKVWDKEVNDKNYPRSGLETGKYFAEIYELDNGSSTEDLVKIGERSGRIMGGARGVAILSLHRHRLPEGKRIICVDRLNNLWKAGGDDPKVPGIFRRGKKDWRVRYYNTYGPLTHPAGFYAGEFVAFFSKPQVG